MSDVLNDRIAASTRRDADKFGDGLVRADAKLRENATKVRLCDNGHVDHEPDAATCYADGLPLTERRLMVDPADLAPREQR